MTQVLLFFFVRGIVVKAAGCSQPNLIGGGGLGNLHGRVIRLLF